MQLMHTRKRGSTASRNERNLMGKSLYGGICENFRNADSARAKKGRELNKTATGSKGDERDGLPRSKEAKRWRSW